ncbi:MAG: Cna B-type domain-containing protein [Oscillospiraceae bacterium]|nr:Cna B-type domain-containing protein [Oscillospiraceae bacterium]
MSTSFKKKIRLLAALLTVILLLAGLSVSTLAASVIDWNTRGSLMIQPKYNDTVVTGCTFNICRVAEIQPDSAVLQFNLTGVFQNAQDQSGNNVDLRSISTASELESAAAALVRYIGNAAPADIISLNAGSDTVSDLPLGMYLVVQTSAPGNYTAASPFLVMIPSTNDEGTEWDYAITANPKLGYYSYPPSSDVNVQVIKEWNDAGFESKRPSSITVTLLRNGKAYGQARTLSTGNDWTCEWRGLDSNNTWSVDETGVPDGYISTIDSSSSGNTTVFTITNIYETVPLGSALTVNKVWNDNGYESYRPSSVTVDLLKDGAVEQTVTLDASNSWSYAWTGLDSNSTWSVAESNIPSGYTASVKREENAYTITNSYGTDVGTNIPDDAVPLAAPQTGLVQWPIPVLLSVGALLVVAGVAANYRKKHGKE